MVDKTPLADEVPDYTCLIEEGKISESISFETIIDLISKEDKNAKDLIAEVPTLIMLLRTIHKQGFWRGVAYGDARESSLPIKDDEELLPDR